LQIHATGNTEKRISHQKAFSDDTWGREDFPSIVDDFCFDVCFAKMFLCDAVKARES